jgi:hypothetical protein
MLHLYTAIFHAEGRQSVYLFVWFLWSCAPYVVALALLLLVKKPTLALGFGAASLCFDIFMFISVFVRPTSSTAALGLVVMPFWNLILFGPAGALVVWLAVMALLRNHKTINQS